MKSSRRLAVRHPRKRRFTASSVSERVCAVTDPFQQAVLRILVKHGFYLGEFSEKEDWLEPLRKTCQDISHFLEEGESYSMEGTDKIFFPGSELLLWILTLAKETKQEGRMANMAGGVVKASQSGEIFGHPIGNVDIIYRFIVAFDGQWARELNVLADIFCDVDGGEEFVRGFLDIPKNSLKGENTDEVADR